MLFFKKVGHNPCGGVGFDGKQHIYLFNPLRKGKFSLDF